MMLARSVRPVETSDPDPVDQVALDYQARYLRRRRLETVSGRAVLVDLAEARNLGPGDRLILKDGGQIEVLAQAEPLVRIDGADLARLAWHIGNRHTSCQIEPDHLLIQRDHVLEAMLHGLGAQTTHVMAAFQPEGGAYGHGRTHGHSHSHDPHTDPNAHIPHRHD